MDMQEAPVIEEEPQSTVVPEEEVQTDVVAEEHANGEDGEAGSEEEDDEGEEGSDGEPYLAVTRERRANAGNRMARLLELAEAEQESEEYGEIFQEAANDQEFEEEDEQDEDVNMESSSEEDEAEGEQDEEAGEKELKRQERRENAKKQKRQSLLQQMMKKRTSAAAASAAASAAPGTTPSITPPRPKKKSERVSWLPEDEQQATRASSRKLAVINKQATTQRLKEKEKHRLRTVEIMKAAEQRKEAAKPKAMTQADRLAEAARIERENSRSVRKWEEIERRKEEERKAKIAALKNRKLEGPVISYWSGPALWVGDKRTHVGKGKVIDEAIAESRGKTHDISPSAMEVDEPKPAPAIESQPSAAAVLDSSAQSVPRASSPHSTASEQAQPVILDGIHYYASLPSQEQSQQSPAPSAPTADAPTPSIGSSTPHNETQPGATLSQVLLQQTGSTPTLATASTPTQVQSHSKSIPAEPPLREVAARSLITLVNFNPEPKPKDRDGLLRGLISTPDAPYIPPVIGRWSNRLPPAITPACAVTHKTARYRDPLTGLPYLDSYALKVIRRLADGKFVWSERFEVWLGERVKPARGVPPGFEDPSKVRRKEDVAEGEAEKMDVSA